jgi:hypothetical protein
MTVAKPITKFLQIPQNFMVPQVILTYISANVHYVEKHLKPKLQIIIYLLTACSLTDKDMLMFQYVDSKETSIGINMQIGAHLRPEYTCMQSSHV